MPDVRIDVYTDEHGSFAKLSDIEKGLKGVEGQGGKTGTALGGLWKQFAIGTLAVDALKKSYELFKGLAEGAIKGAIDEEKAENNLRAALEITGRTVEGNIQHYLEFAEAKMKATTYTHEEIEASQTLLLQLTNLDQKGLDRATKGSMGLATTMGIDLHSATMMVTKAMEGNYQALGRVGIKVNETMTTEQKQAYILERLDALYQRSTAETNTFGGSLKQLKNSWGELLETAGTAVIKNEAVRDAIKDLKAWIDKVAASPEFQEWLKGAVESLVKAAEFAGKFAKAIIEIHERCFSTSKAQKELNDTYAEFHRTIRIAIDDGRDWTAEWKAAKEAAEKLKKPINETGTATRVLTAEEIKAIEAKKKLAEAAQEIINKYNPLRAAMAAATKQEQALTKAREAGTISAEDYRAGMDGIQNSLKDTIDKLGALKPTIADIDKAFQALMATMDNLPLTSEEVADAMSKEFEDLRDEMQKDFEELAMKDLPAHLQNIPAASEQAADATKSVWQECSTVISDSMRNIASEVVGMFNLKDLFGAAPKEIKFDSSYYDDMVKAATSAYEKVKDLIESNTDAAIDAASRAYDAQELQISRAEEDADLRRSRHEDAEDRKYEAQYERDKKAIENSKMTEAQKEAALDALEKKFEAAKLAREIAREDAKVARERRREDARYRRQEAEERKIERIRSAGLQKLLDLQNKHQADLDAIRVAEDLARKKQADDEEARQKSLWFKVKGIFATAVEEMATIWITQFIMKLMTDIGLLKPALEGLGAAGTTAATGLGATITSAVELTTTLGFLGAGLLVVAGFFGLLTGDAEALRKELEKEKKLLWDLRDRWIAMGYSIRDANTRLREYIKLIDEASKREFPGRGEHDGEDGRTPRGEGFSNFTSGGKSTRTELAMLHGTPNDPEFIFRGSQMRGLGQVLNLTIPFYLGTEKIDERMLRIANGRVEWLHSQYQRSNRMIPPRTIGGT